MLGAVLIIFVAFQFAIALWVRGGIKTAEDYLVAGRRLSFPLAFGTILATWVGAGTILATADEVRAEGFRGIGLEPLGPGIALLIVAVFFAKPLWHAKLLTVNDLYRQRFGRHAEWLSCLFMVGYLPWIAATLVSAAGLLNAFFDFPIHVGILLVAAIAVGYTLIGGMWSVTLTDFCQLGLIVVGLGVLLVEVLEAVGGGLFLSGMGKTLSAVPVEERSLIPLDSLREFHAWLGYFLAGSVGLVASQDLLQRVFAARSARVAVWSCAFAGVFYLLLGCVPVLIGLASRHLIDADVEEHVTAMLARSLMSPTMQMLFLLGLASAILSTIDSAILAPASVLAQNLIKPLCSDQVSVIRLTQGMIVIVALASVGFAVAGERAFGLLEASYSSGFALFVVLSFAVFQKRETSSLPAVVVLVLGLGIWLTELVTGWQGVTFGGVPVRDADQADVPVALLALVVELGTYVGVEKLNRRLRR